MHGHDYIFFQGHFHFLKRQFTMVKDIFPSGTFPVAYLQDNGTLSYETEISLKFKTKKHFRKYKLGKHHF